MKLQDLLIQYRKEHGLSQRQFAIKCKLSNGYISILEKGVNPKTGKPVTPTFPQLKKLADGMSMTIHELCCQVDDMPIFLGDDPANDNHCPNEGTVSSLLETHPYNPTHRIPILGRISAGLPLYAEEHIEGYTYTELNGGAEYFALRVSGDSMNAARIYDGDTLIVRRQDVVDNGEIAVVMVNGDEATVKRFYRTASGVTLMPQSTNPIHQPQIYDTRTTSIRVIGLVVKNEITF